MSTTIAAAFAEFKANLEITDPQAGRVSATQQQIREALSERFSVTESFLAGSYARSTLTAPLAEGDVDIFLVLDSSYYYNHTPTSLLKAVRGALRERYPSTQDISPDGQAVTIAFQQFRADVVPCFRRQGGGYLIPNEGSGQWIETDPTVHATVITAANKTHVGSLVPLVKMMKAWNRAAGAPLTGFYVELMTMSILNGVAITDYPSGVRFVLDRARQAVRFAQPDPAGYTPGGVLGLNNRATVESASRLIGDAHERAVRAESFGSSVFYIRSAIDEWRALFGQRFPAYG